MPPTRLLSVSAFAALALLVTPAGAQSLRGSSASVARQSQELDRNEYTRLSSSRDVVRFIRIGALVPVFGNANYQLAGVSYPYARPVVASFVERLAAQYRTACGEQLVVTSLTRPDDEQPSNASPVSVHPAGMAVDLRIPSKSTCRKWLEKQLLTLEKLGVIEATREKRPPHLHIAVFPERYAEYAHLPALKTGDEPR